MRDFTVFVANLVHGILNGVELDLVCNFFISCSSSQISWAEVQYANDLSLVCALGLHHIILLILMSNGTTVGHVVFCTILKRKIYK